MARYNCECPLEKCNLVEMKMPYCLPICFGRINIDTIIVNNNLLLHVTNWKFSLHHYSNYRVLLLSVLRSGSQERFMLHLPFGGLAALYWKRTRWHEGGRGLPNFQLYSEAEIHFVVLTHRLSLKALDAHRKQPCEWEAILYMLIFEVILFNGTFLGHREKSLFVQSLDLQL